jgi:hypothetical protein
MAEPIDTKRPPGEVSTIAPGLGAGYGSLDDERFQVMYRAHCPCGAVRYEACADPVDAKLCHCHGCQRLHGAPMQWAAIFHKRDVRLVAGARALCFYNSDLNRADRTLPCKVRCGRCGAPIADEGRTMWLAFPALFELGHEIPKAFRPTCHIFYGSRVIDVHDELPKWSGHKDASTLL